MMESLTVATFALAADGGDGAFVLRSGKLFEVGAYPDKEFALTEEELARAVAAFSPVPNNLEHTNTVLDGQLGEVRRVERRGRELFGVVAIPRWLDAIIGAQPLKASLEWARETKLIVGNALVLNPRVPDAQLVAAFTAANSVKKEQVSMKTLKARFLALFSGGKKAAEITEDELQAVFAATSPAVTPEEADAEPSSATAPAAPATDNAEAEDDAAVAADKSTPAPPAPPAPTPGTPSPAIAAELAKLQRSLLQAQADAWFVQELAAGRVFPAQRETLVSLFAQAALADAGDTVCFRADGALTEGALLTALKATVAAYPPHQLTQEQLPGTVVLMSAGGDAGVTRKQQLRATYGLPAAE